MTDWRLIPCPDCRGLNFNVRHDTRGQVTQVECADCRTVLTRLGNKAEQPAAKP